MDRILGYEKKFMITYAYMLCILLLYMIIFSQQVKNDAVLAFGLLATIGVYILSLIFGYFKFFNNKKFFLIFKYATLIILALFFLSDSLFIMIATTLCYIFICIEFNFVFSHEEPTIKRRMLLFTYIPIVMSYITFIIVEQKIEPFHFFCWIQFVSILYGIYIIINYNTNEMLNTIADATQLWENSQEANRELLASQNEVKQAYEQLALQKLDMEQTNKTLNRITSEMYIQNELLRYIGSTLELDQLMDLVTDSIIGAIGVDTCSLIINNIEGGGHYLKTKSNSSVEIEEQLREALEHGDLQCYFEEANSYIDSFVLPEKYPFIRNRLVGSLIIIPLIRNDAIYGLLISEHTSTGFFGENNLQFFQSIATQINIAVNNASLYTKMEELATKDGLTGLYNRRHFQKKLMDLFELKEKHRGKLVVIMIDIDKFKNVNDTYGHLFGDEAIKMVSRIAQKYANQTGGFAGRYGGEEFVIVIPDTGLNEAVSIMRNMHEEIKSEALFYDRDRLVYINISIGVTAYPDFGTSAEDLLNRADNAMYYSKEHGRGKITIDALNLTDLV